jgi:hypothetical protein
MRIFLIPILFCFSSAILSCMVPSPEEYRDHAALVNDSSSIMIVDVLADNASIDKGCQFRLVHVLKGKSPSNIPIACTQIKSDNWTAHFSGHTERRFWKDRIGRLGFKSDCSIIPPTFKVGRYYLLLFGSSPDNKQFEEISGPMDRWFIFVKKQILKNKR